MGAAASLARIVLASAALSWVTQAAGSEVIKVASFTIGSGRSEIAEYDRDLRLLRRYTGFLHPSDVTATADGRLLVVEEGLQMVEFDRDGTVLRRDEMNGLLRARPRPGGGLLLSAADKVIALRPDRSIEFEIPVAGLRAAVALPGGNVLVAYNERQGWLAEMTSKGEVVRRTAVSGYTDATGRWVDESPELYFTSVFSLDVAPDGTIFASNFDASDVRLLTPDLRLVESFGPFAHATDTRFGPNGELIAVSAEQGRVWIRSAGGEVSQLNAPMEPRCATLTPWGTLVVGLWWNPENTALNASALRAVEAAPLPWWQKGLPLPAAGVLLSLLVAWRVRRNDPWAIALRPESGASGRRSSDDSPASAKTSSRLGRVVRVAAGVACVGVVAAGLNLAWAGLQLIYGTNYFEGSWRFLLGGALGGLALRLLNGLAGGSRLSTLDPAGWKKAPRRDDGHRTDVLLGASLLALAACLVIQLLSPEFQAAGIAFWIAAQVWILAAAFPPLRPAPDDVLAPRKVWPWLALLLAFALATRLWQIGYYPDNIHSDHNLYGLSVLALLRGEWRPFFILDPVTSTYGRPWLLPAAAALTIFGAGYEVLRLTSAFSAMLMVWGGYLFASTLFNRRVGLIAAALVAANHALLLYSRQPYVIESTAPFLLLLYAAFTGARRGCRFHWCLAGVVAGWAMLSPRQSTMFPIICGAIFLYSALVYPRAAWRQLGGLAWMAAGAAAVYLPMVPHMVSNTALSRRLSTTMVFFNPDGSVRWDKQLWMDQVGRSFGSIVFFHDSSAWGIGTWQPICLKLEACIFAVGLAYLLTSWRGPSTIAVLATIGLSIFLGSAILTSPPTFYHYFVGMVAVLVVCAVALDRLAAILDSGPRAIRALAAAALSALVVFIGYQHVSLTWRVLERSSRDGKEVFGADAAVVAARFIRHRPDYRYYLVRSMRDHSATSPEFYFAAADTDVSDISTDLRHVLPVPPAEGTRGAMFVVMPSRAGDREIISEFYPTAKPSEFPCEGSEQSVWVYEVDAEEMRRVASR